MLSPGQQVTASHRPLAAAASEKARWASTLPIDGYRRRAKGRRGDETRSAKLAMSSTGAFGVGSVDEPFTEVVDRSGLARGEAAVSGPARQWTTLNWVYCDLRCDGATRVARVHHGSARRRRAGLTTENSPWRF